MGADHRRSLLDQLNPDRTGEVGTGTLAHWTLPHELDEPALQAAGAAVATALGVVIALDVGVVEEETHEVRDVVVGVVAHTLLTYRTVAEQGSRRCRLARPVEQ